MDKNFGRQPGVFQTSQSSGWRAPKFEMRFGGSKRLGEFVTNYQFFSPALLYLYGRFTDEPLIQYMNEKNTALKLMFKKFRHAIFQGMNAPDGDADWNFVLWAVQRDHWPDLENFLISVMFFDHPTKWLMKVGSMDVSIVDPLGVDRHVVSPDVSTIPIVVLGVNGNRHCVAVEPTHGTLLRPPQVKIHPPQDSIVKLAETMFSGKVDPTDVLTKG